MSDTNDIKQDDDIIDHDTDSRSATYHPENVDFSTSDQRTHDLDDGDDEDGIFADSAPIALRKSGGRNTGGIAVLAGVVAVIAVAGGVYYTNPDIVGQVAKNVTGAASEIVATAETASETFSEPGKSETANSNLETAPLTAPSPDSMDVAQATEMPIVDNPLTAQEPAPVALEVKAPEVSKTEEPEQEKYVPSPDATTMAPQPDVAVVESSVDPVMTGKIETMDLTATPADGTTTPEVKVIEETPQEQPVVKVDAPADGTANQTAIEKTPSESVAVTPNVTTPDSGALATADKEPEEEKPSPLTAQDKKDADLDKALGVPAEQKETVFFDAPSGKILDSIPTPSMNPLKGKGESIIIVHGRDEKKAAKKTENKTVPEPNKSKANIIKTDMEAQILAANRALRLGRYDAAADMFDRLYALNPRDGRVLMGRAVVLQKTGQTEEAVRAYEAVLVADPSNTDAVVNLAGLIRKQYPAAALNKLLDMKEKYPRNVSILAQLGVAYADSGNLEDAYRSLNAAALLEPQNPQHYYNMAVIAERLRDTAKAISLYEKALEVDAVHGSGRAISRERIYDRLTQLRGN